MNFLSAGTVGPPDRTPEPHGFHRSHRCVARVTPLRLLDPHALLRLEVGSNAGAPLRGNDHDLLATDLSKPYAGTLSGIMNTGANLGGTLSPTLTPLLADTFGWPVALGLAAGLAFLGGLCWFLIRPGSGLNEDRRS